MPWSVVITHYDDDYKCRGDWSSNQGPYLFTNEADANAWLLRYLVQHIEQEVREYSEMLEEDGKLSDYGYAFTKSLQVKNCYRSEYADLNNIAKTLVKGEYVPRRMEWEVQKVTIDDKVTDLLDYGPKTNEGEESSYNDSSDDEDEEEVLEKEDSESEYYESDDEYNFSECSKAKSFDELLKSSKRALVEGLPTLVSGTNHETCIVLVSESLPYLNDFLRMHDLRFMTIDSQPGCSTQKIGTYKESKGHYINDEINSHVDSGSYIHSQRQYVDGLTDRQRALLLVKELENEKDICIVMIDNSNVATTYNPILQSKEPKSIINLTKHEYPNLTWYTTNCHILKSNSTVNLFLPKLSHSKAFCNIVNVSIIYHQYNVNGLYQRVIKALEAVETQLKSPLLTF
jgi:hypothetical protein